MLLLVFDELQLVFLEYTVLTNLSMNWLGRVGSFNPIGVEYFWVANAWDFPNGIPVDGMKNSH